MKNKFELSEDAKLVIRNAHNKLLKSQTGYFKLKIGKGEFLVKDGTKWHDGGFSASIITKKSSPLRLLYSLLMV